MGLNTHFGFSLIRIEYLMRVAPAIIAPIEMRIMLIFILFAPKQ